MIRLAFPAPARPWSINEERRRHWAWRSRMAAEWRDAAFWWARHARLGPCGPSVVRVVLPVTRGGRRDPSNFLPAAKAVVDGLVLAGLWPDDGPAHVSLAEPVLAVGSDVVVEITSMGA